MKNEYSAKMALRSNEQLISIVTVERDDYLPEALDAARAELVARDLSVEELEQATEEVQDGWDDLESHADEPLGDGWKALMLVLPVFGLLPGILGLSIMYSRKAKGYVRQYEEAKQWLIYGFMIWVGLILIGLIAARVLAPA